MAAEDRRTAKATLAAAIVAAMAALTGSILAYQQSQTSVSASTAQKVAELRIEAYGEFAEKVAAARQRIFDVGWPAARAQRQLVDDEAMPLWSLYYGLAEPRGKVSMVAPDEVVEAFESTSRSLYTLLLALDSGESGAAITDERFRELHEENRVALVNFYSEARKSISVFQD